jgi:hypothetical protein
MIELIEFIEGDCIEYDLNGMEGLLESASDLALKKFNMDREVSPLFIFVSPHGSGVAMVAPQWSNNRDKDAVIARLRLLFKAVRSPRYAPLTEGGDGDAGDGPGCGHAGPGRAPGSRRSSGDRREPGKPLARRWDIRGEGKPELRSAPMTTRRWAGGCRDSRLRRRGPPRRTAPCPGCDP